MELREWGKRREIRCILVQNPGIGVKIRVNPVDPVKKRIFRQDEQDLQDDVF